MCFFIFVCVYIMYIHPPLPSPFPVLTNLHLLTLLFFMKMSSFNPQMFGSNGDKNVNQLGH